MREIPVTIASAAKSSHHFFNFLLSNQIYFGLFEILFLCGIISAEFQQPNAQFITNAAKNCQT